MILCCQTELSSLQDEVNRLKKELDDRNQTTSGQSQEVRGDGGGGEDYRREGRGGEREREEGVGNGE